MESVEATKAQGNELFKAERFKEAAAKYDKALQDLRAVDGAAPDADGDGSCAKMQVTLLCNLAACALKRLEEGAATDKALADECVKFCDDAIALDPECVKAHYRKAQALALFKKDLQGAIRAVKILLSIDKGNKPALAMMQNLQQQSDDAQSTTAQAIKLLESLPEKESEEAENELRRVLGSIMDDPVLAKSICTHGACDILWKLFTEHHLSFAVVLLSKLSSETDTAPFVLPAVDAKILAEFATGEGEASGENEAKVKPDYRGAGLQCLTRLASNESLEKVGESAVLGDSEFVLSTLCKGLRSAHDTIRKSSVESIIRYCGEDGAKAKVFVEGCSGLSALMSLITPSKDTSAEARRAFKDAVQQVAIVLGRLLPSLKNDDLIKAHALAFCKPALKSVELLEQLRGAAALLALAIANTELGLAIVEEDGMLDVVNELARTSPARTQSLVCEIYSYLANSEKGRAMMNEGEAKVILQVLVQSDNADVRSAAAVALTKLNAIDFKAESNEGALVMHSVLGLLRASATKEEHAKGVEAVSFVITDTDVKMTLCQGEGLKVLRELVRIVTENDKAATEPYAYGLSYVYENLTMSEDDKKREKLREMEVTQEQWEQFEKLTKSETRKGKPDPQENVNFRIKAFVEADGAAAMRSLVLNGASDRVCQAIARAYCNIASVPEVRGQLFKQGAARALIELASKDQDEKTKAHAAHALGKMLITTDPHLVGHSIIMDCIAPLVKQVRYSDSDLVIFECSMALTNLSVLSEETKRKIISCRALQAFEYASYSDDLLVRRAAVEAINNLLPEEKAVEWFLVAQHMRIWLMFASDYEADMETSRAATGALANICSLPEVAKLIEEQDKGLPTLVVLLACGIPEIIHRVAVCFLQLMQSLENAKEKLLALKLDTYIQKALLVENPGTEILLQVLEQLTT